MGLTRLFISVLSDLRIPEFWSQKTLYVSDIYIGVRATPASEDLQFSLFTDTFLHAFLLFFPLQSVVCTVRELFFLFRRKSRLVYLLIISGVALCTTALGCFYREFFEHILNLTLVIYPPLSAPSELILEPSNCSQYNLFWLLFSSISFELITLIFCVYQLFSKGKQITAIPSK